MTESLFDLAADDPAPPGSGAIYYGTAATQGVSEASFPLRVAVLLRSRPIADATDAGSRQDWPDDVYDISTLSLAAIDLVISQQGFEHEATYDDVVAGLMTLARRASPHRPTDEHRKVAMFVIDALLNRGDRGEEFAYRISDYSAEADGHLNRQIRFRLLVEHEDPVRGEPVLKATRDAINALIGGLEFDVDDEQVANEVLLERQLARGAFDAAERSATIARLLSVSLGEELTELIKETQRDLRNVLDQWAQTVPTRLSEAREHIEARLDVEHRLQDKVRESIEIADPGVATSAARIAGTLAECQRRHEALHKLVINARSIFLVEQDRQSFRPTAQGYRPDLTEDVFTPMLLVDTESAMGITARWLTDVAGPRPVPIPTLYRVVADLWAIRETPLDAPRDESGDEVGEEDPPVITEQMIGTAQRAVARCGLPARVSALIAACLCDEEAEPSERHDAAQIVSLAALWCFSPEDADTSEGAVDLSRRVLGPRAAADADDTLLMLDGWDGDDLIVAAFADALEAADPVPVVKLTEPAGGR